MLIRPLCPPPNTKGRIDYQQTTPVRIYDVFKKLWKVYAKMAGLTMHASQFM